jgi:hypothetical protein
MFTDELRSGNIRKKGIFRFCRNPVTFHSFGKAMRVTPSLPQRGRQPKGNIPLTPFLHLSHFKKRILVNFQRAIVFFYECLIGAEAKVAAAQ